MKSREEKKKEVDLLKAELERCRNLIVSAFSGMTVAQDYELRRQVRNAGGKYRVVKNRLAELAAQGSQAEGVLKNLAGPTALAYTEQDPVALAKALTAYAKANPSFTFRAGVVEGRVISIAEIHELAGMSNRQELMSKLVFLLSAPAQWLATVSCAVPRQLAVVLHRAAAEKKFQE